MIQHENPAESKSTFRLRTKVCSALGYVEGRWIDLPFVNYRSTAISRRSHQLH